MSNSLAHLFRNNHFLNLLLRFLISTFHLLPISSFLLTNLILILLLLFILHSYLLLILLLFPTILLNQPILLTKQIFLHLISLFLNPQIRFISSYLFLYSSINQLLLLLYYSIDFKLIYVANCKNMNSAILLLVLLIPCQILKTI